MRVYETDAIRNIGIIGHGAAGKTSLTSAILFDSGAVNRLARVEDGNTVTDWEEEEIERKISISSSLAHCDWNKIKINILDTPGYRPFLGETKLALRAADAAVVVVDSVAGVEVQTEGVWEFADEFRQPRIVVVNKMDRDNASFERAMDSLQEAFGRSLVPIQLPIGAERDFTASSTSSHKACAYQRDGSGKFQEEEIPAALRDEAAAAREKLIEMVAEGSDELMEKFFAEERSRHRISSRVSGERLQADHRPRALRQLDAKHWHPADPECHYGPASLPARIGKVTALDRRPRSRSNARSPRRVPMRPMCSRQSPIPSRAASA